eukprot:s373_g27.t1
MLLCLTPFHPDPKRPGFAFCSLARLRSSNTPNETTKAEPLDEILGVWALLSKHLPYSSMVRTVLHVPCTATSTCHLWPASLHLVSKPLKSSWAQSVRHPLESTGRS